MKQICEQKWFLVHKTSMKLVTQCLHYFVSACVDEQLSSDPQSSYLKSVHYQLCYCRSPCTCFFSTKWLFPGGLANLFPRLTIVRKIDAGDGSYPSVNTCVHYLKLPGANAITLLVFLHWRFGWVSSRVLVPS